LVFQFLRLVNQGAICEQRVPITLDKATVDKLQANKKWLEDRAAALTVNRKQQHEIIVREVNKLEAELAATEAEIVAEYERASPGKMEYTPDALDQLLGLYDRVLAEGEPARAYQDARGVGRTVDRKVYRPIGAQG